MKATRAVGAAALASACALLTGSSAPAPAPTLHVIEMRDFGFSPVHVEAALGDTLVWINADVVPHTATDSDKNWDSGAVEAGERWSRVVTVAGEYSYECAYHPTMRATLTVTDSRADARSSDIQEFDDGR